MANGDQRSYAFSISVDSKNDETIVQLIRNVKNLDEATDALTKAGLSNAKAVDKTTDSQKILNREARAAIAEYNRQAKKIDQVTNEYDQLNKAMKSSTYDAQVFNAQMRAGVDPLSKQGREIEMLVKDHQQLTAAQNKTQGSMRGLRGQAQNLGWQLQDIAVQAQMGTNAMVIMTQQGSQILSGFGAMGALAGAGLAVFGAAAMALLPNLIDTKSATDRLDASQKALNDTFAVTETSFDGLKKEYRELSEISTVWANAIESLSTSKLAVSAVEAEKAVNKITNGFRSLSVVSKTMGEGSTVVDNTFKNMAKSLGTTEEQAATFFDTLNDGDATYSEISNAALQYISQINAEGDATGANVVKQGEMIDKLLTVAKTYRLLGVAKGDVRVKTTDNTKAVNDELTAYEKLQQQLDNEYTSWENKIDLLGKSSREADLYKNALVDVRGENEAIINAYYDQKEILDKKIADEKRKLAITNDQLKAEKALADFKNSQVEIESSGDLGSEYERRLAAMNQADVNYASQKAALDIWLWGEAKKLNDKTIGDKQSESDKLLTIDQRLNDDIYSATKRQYTAELALYEKHGKDTIQLTKEFQDKINEIKADNEPAKKGLEGWLEATEDALKDYDSLVENSLDRMVDGFGTAFADSVTGASSLGDAVSEMFSAMGYAMLKYFGEWAAQKTLMWLLDKTLGATAQTAAATQTGLNAAASVQMSGLHAFESTAKIPYVGAFLAPAAAATAIGLTAPMAASATAFSAAAIGAYDKGGAIPAGGLGIVSEIGDEFVGGTLVHNASSSNLNVTGREDTAKMLNGGGGSNHITINTSGNMDEKAVGRAVDRALRRRTKKTDNAVYDSMNRGRKNKGAKFNA